MMPEPAQRLILPGQWVRVWVQTLGGLWHHGIVQWVYRNGDTCIEIVHNVKNTGVMVSSLEEFSNGGLVFLERRPISPAPAEVIVRTAEENIGKEYSAFSQNCEHFCAFCYTWEAKSETVQAWVSLAALAGLAFAAFTSDSNRR